MLGGGKTRQAVADELGWTKQQVQQYASMQRIDPKAWELVTTTVRDFGGQPLEGAVDGQTTVVVFTERLLRVLPPLLPEQQHELCQTLARGGAWRTPYIPANPKDLP